MLHPAFSVQLAAHERVCPPKCGIPCLFCPSVVLQTGLYTYQIFTDTSVLLNHAWVKNLDEPGLHPPIECLTP